MPGESNRPSDEQLAVSSQSGDFAAFESLVYRYENRIYAFLRQICRCDADAREAAQDTFVQAFKSIGQFDSRRTFAAWLFTIARRKGIDRMRSRLPLTGEEFPDSADGDNPADLLIRREDSEGLWKNARAALSDGQFQAVWLRYAEEMEIAQIASVMGKTEIHVRVLLFRARQKLAAGLGPAAPLPLAATKGAVL